MGFRAYHGVEERERLYRIGRKLHGGRTLGQDRPAVQQLRKRAIRWVLIRWRRSAHRAGRSKLTPHRPLERLANQREIDLVSHVVRMEKIDRSPRSCGLRMNRL